MLMFKLKSECQFYLCFLQPFVHVHHFVLNKIAQVINQGQRIKSILVFGGNFLNVLGLEFLRQNCCCFYKTFPQPPW